MSSAGAITTEVQPQKRKRMASSLNEVDKCKKVRITKNEDYSKEINKIDDKINIVQTELAEIEAALGIEVHPFIFESMKKCINSNDEPKIIIEGLKKLKDDLNYRLHYVEVNQVNKDVQDNLYLRNKFWLKQQSLLKILRILENHINILKQK